MKSATSAKMATRLRAARLLARRSFHLGTDAYHSAFSPAIAVDTDKIRAAAVAALDAHDSGTWFTSPMVSLLGGERLADGASAARLASTVGARLAPASREGPANRRVQRA